MLQSIELELAGRYVHEYEEVMRHHLSTVPDDYDDYLAKGVVAFRWIVRAEEVIRTAVDCGLLEFSDELRKRFETLYDGWLESCQRVETWAVDLPSNGHSAEHLADFNACCDEARAWVEQNDWRQCARSARDRRFAEEPW
jgi:hypothetical protein